MKTEVAFKDAIALLKADHKEVKDLFDEFEKAKNSSQKEKIVQQALKELRVHTIIEEEIFYPAVREALGEEEEEEELMDEAEEEHRVAKTLVKELLAASADDENYDAKFMVLAENVRHHIKEEEGEMFKEAKGADVDLKELGERMMTRKEELMSDEEQIAQAEEQTEVKPYQELVRS